MQAGDTKPKDMYKTFLCATVYTPVTSIVFWERMTPWMHRVDRLLGFFSNLPSRDPPTPTPSPAGEYASLWVRGDTLACGRGGGWVPIQTRGQTPCGTLGKYVLCAWMYRLLFLTYRKSQALQRTHTQSFTQFSVSGIQKKVKPSNVNARCLGLSDYIRRYGGGQSIHFTLIKKGALRQKSSNARAGSFFYENQISWQIQSKN